MAPSSRDRITVDLHGLKAALFERALALGVSPSGLVRATFGRGARRLRVSRSSGPRRAAAPSGAT